MYERREQTQINEKTDLHSRRLNALQNLNEYLKNMESSPLFEYQHATLYAMRDFLEQGGTAGYLSLPTGFGKTVVALELIKALDLNTVILSPTRLILEQTARKAKQFSPTNTMSNYYSEEKNLAGGVLNTTYHSFSSLLESGKIDISSLDVVICDELHTALGENRHKFLHKLPNSLLVGLTATPYFTPLEGYKTRGLVNGNERWLNLFEKRIHEMRLEEAIERGILVHLDVNLLKTNVSVNDVQMGAESEYNRVDLERELNKEVRNYLTLALVAGIDALPSHIRFSSQQSEEIQILHAKIKHKRTAIFGLSIAHIEQLVSLLREKGISADTIHANRNVQDRTRILEAHARGDTQVVLGVDALRLGWDSPATEVGIFLAPTRSGIVAVQELGRILRPSPATSKEKAIAIQLVDEFKHIYQSPVLIPHVFDPQYILRGTQIGDHTATETGGERKRGPLVTFSGMDINIVLEQVRTQALLQERFKSASVEEMMTTIEKLIQNIRTTDVSLYGLNLYEKLAELLPKHIPSDAQNRLLQGVASIDSNTSFTATRTLLLLNVKTILAAIAPFLTSEAENDNDLVQHAFLYVHEKLQDIPLTLAQKTTKELPQALHKYARTAVEQYVSHDKNIPIMWVRSTIQKQMEELLQTAYKDNPYGLASSLQENISREINEQTGVNKETITTYLKLFNHFAKIPPDMSSPVEQTVIQRTNRQTLERILLTLAPRKTIVMKLSFGLTDDGIKCSFPEIARSLGISSSRVKQIYDEALIKLRHRTRLAYLSELK